MTVSDRLSYQLDMHDAVIQLKLGDARTAAERMQAALDGYARVQIEQAAGEAWIDSMHSWLAIALSAAGEREAALAAFRRAESRLEAFREFEVLASCRAELGLEAPSQAAIG